MQLNINLKKLKETKLYLAEYLVLAVIYKDEDIELDQNTIEMLEQLEELGWVRLINDKPILEQKTLELFEDSNTDKIKEVLAYMNELKLKHGLGARKFKYHVYRDEINARIVEGNSIEDIKLMLEHRYNKWVDTEWQKYLRPSTLFNRKKFYNYLEEMEQDDNTIVIKQSRLV
jgi:uncharacterized phage protein (TIGR02220 family)